ncbi:Uncharacterized protein HZ326_25651 [Fusarium oxysporum f. sp. albedinis]|nr:Uncharacterized protein HZ326_25651 [Fusarium oxysporum f. sp. albedinis]
MPPQNTASIEVRKKAQKYCFCHGGCRQLEINSTCFSCEQISIPMYTFPRRLLDIYSPPSLTDLTFRDFWALDYHGSHANVLIQEDGSAGFTACSYGLCLNFDVENLVVISFLFS